MSIGENLNVVVDGWWMTMLTLKTVGILKVVIIGPLKDILSRMLCTGKTEQEAGERCMMAVSMQHVGNGRGWSGDGERRMTRLEDLGKEDAE